MHKITLEEAFQAFEHLLEKVRRGEEISIERGGAPVAVLVPPARYALIREAARRRVGEMLCELGQAAADLDPEEAERLAAEVVEEVREAQRSFVRTRTRAAGP